MIFYLVLSVIISTLICLAGASQDEVRKPNFVDFVLLIAAWPIVFVAMILRAWHKR